jgi:hypothetical protein
MMIMTFALQTMGGVNWYCHSPYRYSQYGSNMLVQAWRAHDLKMVDVSNILDSKNNQQTRLGIVATAHMPFVCLN